MPDADADGAGVPDAVAHDAAVDGADASDASDAKDTGAPDAGPCTAATKRCNGSTSEVCVGGAWQASQGCPTACVGAGTCLSAVAVAAGAKHTCVMQNDRSVYCWGDNAFLQLGVTGPTFAATAVPTGLSADNLALGGDTSCSLSSAGVIACWGSNSNGQLAESTATTKSATPHTIPLTTMAPTAGAQVPLALGTAHACALLGDGTVSCWGRGDSGQVADTALPAAETTPNHVNVSPGILLTGALFIGAGGDFTCAGLASSFSCWGKNDRRQLGPAAGAVAMTPTPQTTTTGTLTGIWLGGAQGCLIQNAGTGRCWGNNSNGQTGTNSDPARFPYLSDANIKDNAGTPFPGSFALGDLHSCLRQLGARVGQIYCAGADALGQLGDGAGVDQQVYVPATLGAAKAIAAGGSHACAILTDGSIACWGENDRGQLGDGTQIARHMPVGVRF
jgi:alpha-tubulin suppressor-like RCC1 family protein